MPAKKKPLKKPTDKITVNSRAYGRHERAPRGSRSEAVLNPAMKAHGLRLLSSNIPAKLIKDALIPFRINFKGGMIWQRLLKHFAAQAKKGEQYSVAGIENWEIRPDYPTGRILAAGVKIKSAEQISNLEVSLKYVFSKRVLERNTDTAFRITLIFFFPDFANNTIIVTPHVLPDKPVTDVELTRFIIELPADANSYLLCLKAEGCVNGVVSQNSGNVNKAMSFVGSGIRV